MAFRATRSAGNSDIGALATIVGAIGGDDRVSMGLAGTGPVGGCSSQFMVSPSVT
jgi:hypothetical protein